MNPKRATIFAAAALSLLITACGNLSASDAPRLEPQFGTAGYDGGQDLSVGAGGIYLLGNWDARPKLFRFTRAGGLPWFKGIAPKPGDDEATLLGVKVTPEGDAVVLYSSSLTDVSGDPYDPPTLTRFYLRHVAPNGALLWERTILTTTATIYANELELSLDAAGNLYVALGGGENTLRKYSANGALLWQQAAVGALRQMSVSPDGFVFTSEVVANGETSVTTKLVRTSPSGARLWVRAVPFAVLELSTVRASEVYLSGVASDAYPESVNYLAKYNVRGNQLWQKTIRNARYGFRSDNLAADTQGNVVLALSDAYETGIVAKYTADGLRAWSRTLPMPISDIAVLGTSEIYLTGGTEGDVGGGNHGLADGYLLRLNGGGGRVWIR